LPQASAPAALLSAAVAIAATTRRRRRVLGILEREPLAAKVIGRADRDDSPSFE
jgi:hypothetical protein